MINKPYQEFVNSYTKRVSVFPLRSKRYWLNAILWSKAFSNYRTPVVENQTANVCEASYIPLLYLR